MGRVKSGFVTLSMNCDLSWLCTRKNLPNMISAGAFSHSNTMLLSLVSDLPHNQIVIQEKCIPPHYISIS